MNTPTETSPVKVVEPELSSVFVAFYYKGTDNGMPKEGYDSRVLQVPADLKFKGAEDLKDISSALLQSEFKGEKRFAGLEITLLNLIRLPI